jgi:hypothetical protein
LPKEDHILGNSLHSFYDLEEAGSGILWLYYDPAFIKQN